MANSQKPERKPMRDFRKYQIWQDAISIANKIYSITDSFPKNETYGLSNQIQRAAVSIGSNIAEGASRSSAIEYAHFLEIAIGSAFEVETQLAIAAQRSYISQTQYQELVYLLQKEEKQVNTLIQKIRVINQKPAENKPMANG